MSQINSSAVQCEWKTMHFNSTSHANIHRNTNVHMVMLCFVKKMATSWFVYIPRQDTVCWMWKTNQCCTVHQQQSQTKFCTVHPVTTYDCPLTLLSFIFSIWHFGAAVARLFVRMFVAVLFR